MRTERLRRWGVNLGWLAAFAGIAIAAYLVGRSMGLDSRTKPEPPPVYTLEGIPAQGDIQRTQAGFTGFEADGLGEGQPLLFGRVTRVGQDTADWVPDPPYTEPPEITVTVVDVEARSGEVQLELEDGSRLRALQAGSIEDIVAGSRIAVIGEVEGDTVQATAVLVVLPSAQVSP